MKLGIELSTKQKSIALLTESGDLHSMQWTEDRSQPDPLHENLEALRKKADTPWSALTGIYSGIGPGQYSGMRASVSTATGLALPGSIPSYGISSGWAMAASYSRETGATRVAVLGDARRSSWWCGILNAENESPTVECDWKIYTQEELIASLNASKPDTILTSEKDRCDVLTLDLTSRFPLAEDLLGLTETGLVNKPLPIYLHPAVQT